MTLFLLLLACRPDADFRTLEPYPNPFGPDGDPRFVEQPRRENPLEIAVAGDTAFVSLQGSPDFPGTEVAAVSLESGDVDRIEVGSGPTGVALHPDGELLLVLNRFSNWASVIDVGSRRVVEEIPTDFYAIEAAFSPDGREVWVTNRAKDEVQVWDLDPGPRTLGVTSRQSVPVASNPRDVAVSPDGRTVAVASPTGLSVALIDAERRTERFRARLGAPANGLAFAGDDWLVVATLSRSTHHLPTSGPDGDGDGSPGDGTPNVNFQDLQNEIAVIRVADGGEAHRYTSDTICCKDYRDIDPENLAMRGDLLPPREDWIVGGALPEQVAAADGEVWVTYSASDQLQRFAIDLADGSLEPGPIVETGHNPHGVAIAGRRVLVAARLGETLDAWDRDAVEPIGSWVAGDLSAGAFPSTDAEIGELFNNVAAPFTVDGDQACTMCHREGGNVDKAVSMPLFRYAAASSRMTMAYRGAADTRPWFFESAMDDTNFRPVTNEFARVENFCCSDVTLWPSGAPSDCSTNPPPECDRPNATSKDGFMPARDDAHYPHARPTSYVSRDAFFLAAAQQVIGRAETYGDAVYVEDLITGDREPIPLDFDGITRSLGLFLLQEPALLPNPNDPESAAARRGKALFERADVGCSTCHPAPTFTASNQNNPSGVPVRMGPVVSPARDEEGNNIDMLSDGFAATFPDAEIDTCADICGDEACAEDPYVCDDLRDVRFGAPSLRGLWDRAPSMLHDGRAKSLREVLCTPGHPALGGGETGYNERDGVPDTHGATSHLDPDDIDDLIAYLLTL